MNGDMKLSCHALKAACARSGCWAIRSDRFCTMCQQGVLGDEKHIVFECPALQDVLNRYKNLTSSTSGWCHDHVAG